LADARALHKRLRAAERDVASALQRASLLDSEKAALERELQRERALLDAANDSLREAEDENRQSLWERDRARYRLVRNGLRDPAYPDISVHQGMFTPGRPYLREHHVRDAENNYCYRTDGDGVPPGCVPGRSRRWVRCDDEEGCPPEPTSSPRPSTGGHPMSNGRALRQDLCWWDVDGAWWFIAEGTGSDVTARQSLTREHLLACIEFLNRHALRLWVDELKCAIPRAPCPANAYETPDAFVADTPLMRALVAEKRRRRIRHRRGSGPAPRRYELPP